jgi:hypothetical protein
MSVTSIQFIGLFVVMMNSGAGLHIVLPHFPGTPFADHVSMIQYDPNQIVTTTWPGIAECGPNNSLRCASINLETITFSGATDPAPTDILGAMPHLRCCCTSMSDILAKYKDPNATGKVASHIFVAQGIAEAITDDTGRTDTWVTMHSVDPVGITLTASAGTEGSFSIVFKPGAQFTIQNSVSTPTTSSRHFVAYYLMGIGSSGCTSVPSDGAPCAPRATECVVSKTSAKKQVKSASQAKSMSTAAIHPLHVQRASIDSDCSNSHWP